VKRSASGGGAVAAAAACASAAILLVACASGDPAPPPGSREWILALPGFQYPPAEFTCTMTGIDSDNDGATDECEFLLAEIFAPRLTVSLEGCNVDRTVTPARLGGEYVWAVDRRDEYRYVIAYLPAYYRDCGWKGPKCWLPLVDCAGHIGDSEAILLEISRTGHYSQWVLAGVFLSAHCFSRSTGDCRWYRGRALDRFEWVNDHDRTAPVIWVAEGRQANYPTRSACDAGHSSIDTCDRNGYAYRFPIRLAGNIGSASHPLGDADGCVHARDIESASGLPSPAAVECFWSRDARFRGWMPVRDVPGTTPYARYLFDIGGFAGR
jgi:hypothetical protein